MDLIREGDRFYCNKTLKMASGETSFIEGKSYISDDDGTIINEQNRAHLLGTWRKYFTKTPHPVETCGCPLCQNLTNHKDKDYFQSVQEEYGKACGTEPTGTELLITQECEDLKNLLIGKNRAYGDSALSRGSLFDISPVDAIKARINDKLARIQNSGLNDQTEDSLRDVMGYMVLLRIAIKQQN